MDMEPFRVARRLDFKLDNVTVGNCLQAVMMERRTNHFREDFPDTFADHYFSRFSQHLYRLLAQIDDLPLFIQSKKCLCDMLNIGGLKYVCLHEWLLGA